MAAIYTRARSPFYWLIFKKPDGTWGRKATDVRVKSENGRQRAKSIKLRYDMEEIGRDRSGNSFRFTTWVGPFLTRHCRNEKTRTRYKNAWSRLTTYFEHLEIISPSQVTYQVGMDYPDFRQNPPPGVRLTPRAYNTALTELRVLSCIMREAVHRGFIVANPLERLGLKRRPTKIKPEITDDEAKKISVELGSMDEWMRDCWLVAMKTGWRISETAVPLSKIDLQRKTITATTKGNRTLCVGIHEDLEPLVKKAFAEKRRTLVALPKYAAKKWHQFFKRIGMPHLSFHCTRVTVITKIHRSGATMAEAMAYVGHANHAVHVLYQRLTPADVKHLGKAL